jgi:hypothetical protein
MQYMVAVVAVLSGYVWQPAAAGLAVIHATGTIDTGQYGGGQWMAACDTVDYNTTVAAMVAVVLAVYGGSRIGYGCGRADGGGKVADLCVGCDTMAVIWWLQWL